MKLNDLMAITLWRTLNSEVYSQEFTYTKSVGRYSPPRLTSFPTTLIFLRDFGVPL